MRIAKWIPWQLIARKAAKAYGFNDPVETLGRIRKFSRPSETNEPIELLRAGFAFHARGLANTKAIQNNLDWVWPYWIQKQYNPLDESFIPRAFSFSHINLTQRNWTAVSMPDSEDYVIVDPRGLVTPFHDSWSIDFWIVTDSGKCLYPSKEPTVSQDLATGDALAVHTRFDRDGMQLASTTRTLAGEKGRTALSMSVQARSSTPAKLVIAIRPYNPEGIQFIDTIERENNTIIVNGNKRIQLPDRDFQYFFSNYEKGDVAHHLDESSSRDSIQCEAGMATAAAILPLESDSTESLELTVPLGEPLSESPPQPALTWSQRLSGSTQLTLPSQKEQIQFERSLQTLVQLSPKDIYPGPYTYKRFWFRDACLIAHALLRAGQHAACHRALEQFPHRQNFDGYFLSQEGEWDSNGQVLWIYNLFEKLSGEEIPKSCFATVQPAVDWISRKLCKAPGERHDGLLPAGFSAEHFGPNDYYYWDDFWAVGGLKAASELLGRRKLDGAARKAEQQAHRLMETIEDSLENLASESARGHLPASPYRRLDSGAIGSLVSDYPLQLWSAGDSRVTRTADYLFNNCMVRGAFFQDMIHSGINVYLTLDLAQTFLRSGDPRWEQLADKCLELASPTGQWPEAINPRTLGGCMGDGQHAWAAAEWLLFSLNRLVREENEKLIIGSGVTETWLHSDGRIAIDDAPTSHGPISVEIKTTSSDEISIETHIKPRGPNPPVLRYDVPGFEAIEDQSLYQVTLQRKNSSVAKQ